MCSFPHFSPKCFEMLSWNFTHDFVLMYYRSSSSVVTLHPSGSASVHHFSELASYMHWHLSWNFKFDFGFFNAFLFNRKSLYKKSLLKYSWRAYYAPFAVLRYIFHELLPFVENSFSGLFSAMLSCIWMKFGSKLLYEDLQIKFDFRHGWPTFSWVIALCSKFVFRTFLGLAFTYLNESW